jgi:hypothetical protein
LINEYIEANPDYDEDVDGYINSLLKERIDGYMYKCKERKNYTTLKSPQPFLTTCEVCKTYNKLQVPTRTYTEKYITIDFEVNQECGEHKPNYVVAKYYTGEIFRFKNGNAFCEWLISRQHRGYTFIAYNARSYDWYFSMNYCIKNSFTPFTVYKGCQIMSMTLKNVNMIFTDSYKFISQTLSTFPETFGLTELKKGCFPHWLNTTENQTCVRPIPDIKYYGHTTMKECKMCEPEHVCKHWHTRNHFLHWRKERVKEDYVFDFQKETSEYCEYDVDILT